MWSIRTTAPSVVRETPFNLAFGANAVILTEIGIHTLRIDTQDKLDNEKLIRLSLYLLDETWKDAQL